MIRLGTIHLQRPQKMTNSEINSPPPLPQLDILQNGQYIYYLKTIESANTSVIMLPCGRHKFWTP